MSTLIYCDVNDCKNTDHGYDEKIYWTTIEFRDKIEADYEHVCKNCVEIMIADGEINSNDIKYIEFNGIHYKRGE